MSAELLRQPPRRVVGARQTLKTLTRGAASAVFVARDADPAVLADVLKAAEAQKVPVHAVETMAELGRQCGIQVGAACAALLREPTDSAK
ncbi:MAG: ribosomal L7Ae/L30e/S12e/Gadd45 family protein [Actinomycetia bacterium]|nr:ribosomal L7Ae/L30e/S12e/Gadd45 family protein [Actinomycetes bacterium]